MGSKGISRRRFMGRSGSTLAGVVFGAPGLIAASTPTGSSVPASAPPPADAAPAATRILAEWAVTVRPEDVPASARREALRSILNWTGVAIGGSTEPAVHNAVAALQPYAGGGKANLFGRRERFDPLRAALLAGISSHVLDFDDADLTNLIHPAGPVASALFPLSQDRHISGADFLHAFIVGTEVEDRLGNIIYPSHYDMGWHITGTCGVFGAAAACGRILGLNREQMMWALGLAATQASGLKIMFGTMAKSFHPGHAAEDGLLAALLAAKGFTASEQAIEGKEGYIYAASTQHDYTRLMKDLGTSYSITHNGYKPFPSGIVLHSILDGMIQLHDEKHPAAADIKSISIRANPLVLQLTGKKTPQTGLEAKFSVYHAAAISLLRGRAGVKEFSDEAVKDPGVLLLRSLVQVDTDPGVRSDEVYLKVTMNDGTVLAKHVEHALGTLENPMTDRQLEDKFRSLAEGILPPQQVDVLFNQLQHLPELRNAAFIVENGSLR
jgi:2-methylcitrate dehydratase PrpD